MDHKLLQETLGRIYPHLMKLDNKHKRRLVKALLHDVIFERKCAQKLRFLRKCSVRAAMFKDWEKLDWMTEAENVDVRKNMPIVDMSNDVC